MRSAQQDLEERDERRRRHNRNHAPVVIDPAKRAAREARERERARNPHNLPVTIEQAHGVVVEVDRVELRVFSRGRDRTITYYHIALVGKLAYTDTPRSQRVNCVPERDMADYQGLEYMGNDRYLVEEFGEGEDVEEIIEQARNYAQALRTVRAHRLLTLTFGED